MNQNLKLEIMELVDYKSYYPSISDSFSIGWKKMMKYFLPLFLVAIIVMFIDAPMQVTNKSNDMHLPFILMFFAIVFGTAYWLLFRPVFHYGATYIYIQAIRDKDTEVRDIVKPFDNYWNVVLAHLLATMLIGISMVALIIPGIIVACRLAFVRHLVVDKNMDAIEAVETSWRITKGHGFKIFGMGFLSILIILGGLIAFIVGVFPASMWIGSSFAAMYQACLNDAGMNEADEFNTEATE